MRSTHLMVSTTALVALCAAAASAQSGSPPRQPPAPHITAVLVDLTIKPGVERPLVMKTMPEEVRETVRAYLDGKIQQWYARADGRGVVFILNASSVADAKAIMEALPLSKAGYVDLAYTGLQPLTPLRLLLDSTGAPRPEHQNDAAKEKAPGR